MAGSGWPCAVRYAPARGLCLPAAPDLHVGPGEQRAVPRQGAGAGRALAILAAYDRATSLDKRGAVMLGDEMIDEASRKMALVISGKGRAAGMSRTTSFTPPAG